MEQHKQWHVKCKQMLNLQLPGLNGGTVGKSLGREVLWTKI